MRAACKFHGCVQRFRILELFYWRQIPEGTGHYGCLLWKAHAPSTQQRVVRVLETKLASISPILKGIKTPNKTKNSTIFKFLFGIKLTEGSAYLPTKELVFTYNGKQVYALIWIFISIFKYQTSVKCWIIGSGASMLDIWRLVYVKFRRLHKP